MPGSSRPGRTPRRRWRAPGRHRGGSPGPGPGDAGPEAAARSSAQSRQAERSAHRHGRLGLAGQPGSRKPRVESSRHRKVSSMNEPAPILEGPELRPTCQRTASRCASTRTAAAIVSSLPHLLLKTDDGRQFVRRAPARVEMQSKHINCITSPVHRKPRGCHHPLPSAGLARKLFDFS